MYVITNDYNDVIAPFQNHTSSLMVLEEVEEVVRFVLEEVE